jgi:hypothetical protein
VSWLDNVRRTKHSRAVRTGVTGQTGVTRASLWRHRDFVLLWSGQSVSEIGSSVTQLALPLTAVVALRASTFQVGLLTSAATLGGLTLGQLYAVAVTAGVGTVFFDVAYQSYLPEVVERERLVEGNGKLSATQAFAQVTGPSPVSGSGRRSPKGCRSCSGTRSCARSWPAPVPRTCSAAWAPRSRSSS